MFQLVTIVSRTSKWRASAALTNSFMVASIRALSSVMLRELSTTHTMSTGDGTSPLRSVRIVQLGPASGVLASGAASTADDVSSFGVRWNK
jgi:hypothetical protein